MNIIERESKPYHARYGCLDMNIKVRDSKPYHVR